MRRRRVVVVAYVSTIRWNTSCTQKSAPTCIDTKKHYDQIIHTRSLKNAYVRLDRETCIRSTRANTASLLFAPFFPIVPHKYDKRHFARDAEQPSDRRFVWDALFSSKSAVVVSACMQWWYFCLRFQRCRRVWERRGVYLSLIHI